MNSKSPRSSKSAVSAGLEELSMKMWRRLITILKRRASFVSWLDEEDREFLVCCEVLGNSQKAEVAWLQRKCYAYTEVEVDMSKWVET